MAIERQSRGSPFRDTTKINVAVPDEAVGGVVDLDAKDPNEIEIVKINDEVAPEDKGKPTQVTGTSLADQEEDLRGYSKDVQKRINRLKYETNTQRRAAEQASRERDAAVEAARTFQAEAAELRTRNQQNTTAMATAMTGERDARMVAAKQKYKEAQEAGDASKMADATAEMGTIASELTAIKMQTPRADAQPQRTEAPRPQPTPAAPQLTEDVVAWIDHNRSWWGKDRAKTNLATSADQTLQAKGIMPGTPDYVREVDKVMSAAYEDHVPFNSSSQDDAPTRGQAPGSRRVNNVAEGGRDTGQRDNARRVELTPTQLALIKKLNIKPADYARQILKQREREQGESA